MMFLLVLQSSVLECYSIQESKLIFDPYIDGVTEYVVGLVIAGFVSVIAWRMMSWTEHVER